MDVVYDGFVWHVPGDMDLSGDFSGEAYFTDLPARMQPLDQWHITIDSLAANDELVVSVGRIRGRRLGRALDVTGGHVFRFDDDARVAEAWGLVRRPSRPRHLLRPTLRRRRLPRLTGPNHKEPVTERLLGNSRIRIA
jgi:SnoaL-like domain